MQDARNRVNQISIRQGSTIGGTDGTWYKWYIRKIEKKGEGEEINISILFIYYIIIII